MKQIHICGAKNAGGAEMFYYRFVVEMHKREPENILPIVRAKSWMAGQLTKANIPFETAPFGGVFDFSTTKKISKVIAAYKPAIVQAWMSRAAKFTPKTSVPTFARLGGYYSLKYYKTINYLVGLTPDLCQYFIKQNWPADKTACIGNFPAHPAAGFKAARTEIRNRHNLQNNHFVMLLAGRLHNNKGIDTAIYAMHQLPKHARLLIVGDGPLEQSLKAMVEADDLQEKVIFTGWVNNISPYAAAADMWLVPSRHEPMGNTMLDAWAHEIPVAAANVHGPRSLITPEKDGLIFETENPDALAEAVKRILEDKKLYKSLVTNGTKTYQTRHTPDVIFKQYKTLYKKALA